MPGMDGLQLPGEIKQRVPDLPVMMGDRLWTTTSGVAEPVDFDRLGARLRRLPRTCLRSPSKILAVDDEPDFEAPIGSSSPICFSCDPLTDGER
jgi:hypothetical protein